MIKCPLCCGPFQKPKLLPCLDTVCFSCLDEHVLRHGRVTGTFPCPVCEVELPVPTGGVTRFDDNQHIKLEISLDKIANDEQLICEVCDERQEADQRCIDCEQNFCLQCSKAHLRLNIAKTHTLVKVTGTEGRRYLTSIGYCDKHRHEELTFFCRTCMTAVCLRCRLTVHEDHSTEDLVDSATRTRRELKVALDQNKGYRFRMLSEIEELRVYGEQIQSRRETVRRAILERKQQFHDVIDRIYKSMVDRLEHGVKFELDRIDEDMDIAEKDMLMLSQKIATANQMVDFGSDIEVVRCRNDILGSLALARKEVPLSMTRIRMDVDFACPKQPQVSLGYLFGRLSTDVIPPNYIHVTEVSTFRVEQTSDVINAICPALDDKCWVACGWKSEITMFDRYGKRHRAKKVGRDVDCLAVDTDGNCYVSCREEHAVKRFDRNFRRRMATLNIEYPRGIATTRDNKLVICVNKTTTYFDYEDGHVNRVLKLGPDGDESKELKNPKLVFMYPIRVAVNTNNELCVSDNLKHEVLFLRPSGELKTSYDGGRKTGDIAIVRSPTHRNLVTAKTSSTRVGAVSFKPPESRKEQDGPLDIPLGKTVMERTHISGDSPTNVPGSDKAVVPAELSYEDTFVSSVSIGTEMEIDSVPDRTVPRFIKALSGMTGGAETASVTDIESEYHGYTVPQFDPRGITCDRHGHVIVCDYSSNMVHLLDKNGRFLMYLLTEADGIFGPTSVAVDRAGLLWVGGGDATVKIFRYINMELCD